MKFKISLFLLTFYVISHLEGLLPPKSYDSVSSWTSSDGDIDAWAGVTFLDPNKVTKKHRLEKRQIIRDSEGNVYVVNSFPISGKGENYFLSLPTDETQKRFVLKLPFNRNELIAHELDYQQAAGVPFIRGVEMHYNDSSGNARIFDATLQDFVTGYEFFETSKTTLPLIPDNIYFIAMLDYRIQNYDRTAVNLLRVMEVNGKPRRLCWRLIPIDNGNAFEEFYVNQFFNVDGVAEILKNKPSERVIEYVKSLRWERDVEILERYDLEHNVIAMYRRRLTSLKHHIEQGGTMWEIHQRLLTQTFR